MIKKAIVDV